MRRWFCYWPCSRSGSRSLLHLPARLPVCPAAWLPEQDVLVVVRVLKWILNDLLHVYPGQRGGGRGGLHVVATDTHSANSTITSSLHFCPSSCEFTVMIHVLLQQLLTLSVFLVPWLIRCARINYIYSNLPFWATTRSLLTKEFPFSLSHPPPLAYSFRAFCLLHTYISSPISASFLSLLSNNSSCNEPGRATRIIRSEHHPEGCIKQHPQTWNPTHCMRVRCSLRKHVAAEGCRSRVESFCLVESSPFLPCWVECEFYKLRTNGTSSGFLLWSTFVNAELM